MCKFPIKNTWTNFINCFSISFTKHTKSKKMTDLLLDLFIAVKYVKKKKTKGYYIWVIWRKLLSFNRVGWSDIRKAVRGKWHMLQTTGGWLAYGPWYTLCCPSLFSHSWFHSVGSNLMWFSYLVHTMKKIFHNYWKIIHITNNCRYRIPWVKTLIHQGHIG